MARRIVTTEDTSLRLHPDIIVPQVADRKVLAGGTPGATAVNIVQGHAANAIAADIGGGVILGGGTPGNNNIVGGDGSTTVGTATPNASSTGTSAHYSVVGGYDSVSGGLASIVLGFHNYCGVGSTHGTIGGGSFQKIVAPSDYGTIGGGTANTVSGDGATVGGGQGNTASGDHATIGGGTGHTVSGARSTVAGGINNVCSMPNSGTLSGSNNINHGDGAFICGGASNAVGHLTNTTWANYSILGAGFQGKIGTDAQAQYAAMLGGRSNSIQTDYGVIVGGRDNQVKTRNYGVASGNAAVASNYGQHAQASGMFAVAGDAQTSVLVARRQTTTASPLPLLADGTAWNLDLPLNTTWAFTALIVARRTDVDGDNAAFEIKGCISRDAAATSAFAGTPTVTALGATAGASTWTIVPTAATGRLVLTATGEAAKTINWVARITVTEAGG